MSNYILYATADCKTITLETINFIDAIEVIGKHTIFRHNNTPISVEYKMKKH